MMLPNHEETDSDEIHNIKGIILLPCMSKRIILKNLMILCSGFLLLFASAQGLEGLQSTVNTEHDIGLISQSVLYAALIISSLFLPKLMIKKFGCKKTLVMGTLSYIPFFAVNFHLSMVTFIPTAILMGLGAAPLWSAKCTYINEISVLYASQSCATADIVTSRFFGIFFMFFQSSAIWGNLVSFLVLQPNVVDHFENSTFMYHEKNDSFGHPEDVVCGAGFCSGLNENLLPPSDQKRYVLIGIYLGLTILAAAVIGLFLDPLRNSQEDEKDSFFSHISATVKHLKNVDQVLLIPMTVLTGMHQAFIFADFSKAYIACAWGVHHVGLVFICFGTVDAFVSYFSGRLVKYVPRIILMFVAAAESIAVYAVLFLWEPSVNEEYWLFFVLAGMWGMCDAIWQTHLNALYGILFRSEEEAAFSNYRLWEALGFALAYGYSTSLCVLPKICILIGFTCFGIFCYSIVEVRHNRRKKRKIHELELLHT